MTKTVIQHVLSRLRDVGVNHVFGVPGDYAFVVDDAICNDANVGWVGYCNELNASYAADGYARIKGVDALCTAYGVGELSGLARKFAHVLLCRTRSILCEMQARGRHAADDCVSSRPAARAASGDALARTQRRKRAREGACSLMAAMRIRGSSSAG